DLRPAHRTLQRQESPRPARDQDGRRRRGPCVSGLGAARRQPGRRVADQFLKPVVMGQNPLDRERLYQGLWQRNRATTYRAIGAVDIALWDIAGKVAGQPIHRLLGSYRDSVPAYASSAVLASKEA